MLCSLTAAVHCNFLPRNVFCEECEFIVTVKNRIKLILLRWTVVGILGTGFLFIGDAWWWRVKRIPYITNGAGIPASGKILGTGPRIRLELMNMSPDRETYLVFRCDESDIREFAMRFSEVTSIDDWSKSPTRFGPNLRNYNDECRNFDLTKIENGRYWHAPGIVCAIDLDRNIVYLRS